MLRGTGFFHESHAAMDLKAKAGDLDSDIGTPRLDQRSEHFASRPGIDIAQRAPIDLAGGIIKQGTRPFGQRFHPQQHTAHVRMLDD